MALEAGLIALVVLFATLVGIGTSLGVILYFTRRKMRQRAEADAENRVTYAEKVLAPSGVAVAVDEPLQTGPPNMGRKNPKKLTLSLPAKDATMEEVHVYNPRIIIEQPTPDKPLPIAPTQSQSTLDEMSIRTPTASTTDISLTDFPKPPAHSVPVSPCFSEGFDEQDLHHIPLGDDHDAKVPQPSTPPSSKPTPNALGLYNLHNQHSKASKPGRKGRKNKAR